MAPDVADVAEVGEQLADDRLGPAAVGALEVAVLDQRDRRLGRAADVVALGVDRHGEVDQRLRAAEQGPDPRLPGQHRGRRGRPARSGPRRTSAALSTPSFASRSSSPSKASAAISSETVKPMPAIVPPPIVAAQPTGGRSRPAAQPRHQPGDAGDPDRLAEHVADDDPERDRRGVGAARGSRRRSRCRRWRARTAARSRSSSTGGRAAAGARSARPPPSARRAPSGRAPGSAARGSRGTGRSPAPARPRPAG